MTGMVVETKILELGDRRLAYWDVGTGAPLVFIHGVGTAGSIFIGELEPLASEFRLIVYDRRGYGQSSESPRNWQAHREDAERLIDALGVKPAAIVGYSAGGSIALDLVLSRPDVASSLVLLDPAFDIKRCVTPRMIGALLGARVLRKLRGDRAGAAHWMRYVSSYSTGGSAFDKAPAARREALLANTSGLFADSDAGTSFDHIDHARLAKIAIPVTIVDAKLSPPFLRKSCARLRELMPQATNVTLERSGHHVTFDAPGETLAILREAARRRTVGEAASSSM